MASPFARYTIAEPAEGDDPLSVRVLIGAINAPGELLDTREWWVKYQDPELRARFFDELDNTLARLNLEHISRFWPRLFSIEGVFHPYIEVFEHGKRGKQAKIDKALEHVLFPFGLYQYDAFKEGLNYEFHHDNFDDDDDEDEDEDMDIDEEIAVIYDVHPAEEYAEQLLIMHRNLKNPFGYLAWYIHMAKLRDQLRTVPADQWVAGEERTFANWDNHQPSPVVRLLEEATSLRGDPAALRDAQAAIVEVVRANSCDTDLVKKIFPHEKRDIVVKLLHAHFEAAKERIESAKEEIRQVLHVVLSNTGLRSDLKPIIPGNARPGPSLQLWMSDSLVDAALKSKFVSEVASLERSVQDSRQNSKTQVIDLVDPSLYSAIKGVTRLLDTKEAARALSSATTPASHMYAISSEKSKLVWGKERKRDRFKKIFRGEDEVEEVPSFHWLPCEVDVSGASTDAVGAPCEARIRTYINNLHPTTHEGLYGSIESIFARFVPLFDQVCSKLQTEEDVEGLERDGDSDGDNDGESDNGSEPDGEGENIEDKQMKTPYFQKVHQQLTALGATMDCYNILPHGILECDKPSFSLRGSRCQVIVKISEILLTPEHPEYAGEPWQIQGTDSEQILATGLYFFGSENVTESQVAFRQFVREPDVYKQGDHIGLSLTFGIQDGQVLAQDRGRVTVHEDRCIVFPNTHQLKVEPFRLADPTKPGVRKILAFFLVDPTNEPVTSTASVPPQQQEWFDLATKEELNRLGMPSVLTKKIRDFANTAMSLAKAKEYRSALMKERAPIKYEEHDKYVYNVV